MENLRVSFEVILPIFISLALGYLLRRVRLLDGQSVEKLNGLSFKVFLPLFLFNNLLRTDLTQAFNGRLVLFAVLGVTGLFLLMMLVMPLLEKEKPRCGVLVQAVFRSNFALFGLPVAISLCTEERVGPTSLLVGIVVPIYNVLAVVALELFRGGRPSPGKIAKGIATNPLIIASLLGLLVNFAGIPFPAVAEKCVRDLGNVATPLSLIALGADFRFGAARRDLRQLSIAVIGKLVVSPLLLVGAGILCGFRNELLVPILVFSGSPTAVSSYPMAQQMGGDGELAGEAVVFTSAFSVFTMFLWIFALKQCGVI